MDNTLFYKSFVFRTVIIRTKKHNDNSLGIDRHFLARMKTGTGIIRMLDGSELHLTAGDAFYLPLGLQYHSYWTPAPNGEKTVSWDTYGFTYLPKPQNVKYKAQILQSAEEVDAYFDFLAKDQTVSPASVGKLYLLFDAVSQKMSHQDENPKQILFERIKQYIIEHPDFKVSALSKQFSLSESGIYKFIKEFGHTTPIELKNHLQIQKAIRLLVTTDLPIEEISEQLGFCSAVYFRKIFKRETGKTPSELRCDYAQKLLM